MEEKIIIKTFGGFSMSYGGKVITDQDNRSKKLWTILEYIIASHDCSIPQSDIIDMIWTENSISSDPKNALKTCLHRVRGLIDELEIPEKKIIIRKQGTFSWNNTLPCQYDFEDFMECCNNAAVDNKSDNERIEYCMRAFELYKARFLPKCASEYWGANMALMYHTAYIKMMHTFTQLLAKRGDFIRVVEYCSKAAAIDPEDESINYDLIMALYKSGDRQGAIDQYNRVVSLYYDQYGVEPPEELSELYNEITVHKDGFEADLNSIQADLIERNAERAAYLCDYSVFQHFYKIQARACARNGMSIFLLLVTIKAFKGDELTVQQQATAMERMQNVIAYSLRSGDVYARYSKNQFIVMLPAACYENSLMVGERILRYFDNSRPKLKINVSYAVRYLEPQLFEKKAE